MVCLRPKSILFFLEKTRQLKLCHPPIRVLSRRAVPMTDLWDDLYSIFTYIYHYLLWKSTIHVRKYTRLMDPKGVFFLYWPAWPVSCQADGSPRIKKKLHPLSMAQNSRCNNAWFLKQNVRNQGGLNFPLMFPHFIETRQLEKEKHTNRKDSMLVLSGCINSLPTVILRTTSEVLDINFPFPFPRGSSTEIWRTDISKHHFW